MIDSPFRGLILDRLLPLVSPTTRSASTFPRPGGGPGPLVVPLPRPGGHTNNHPHSPPKESACHPRSPAFGSKVSHLPAAVWTTRGAPSRCRLRRGPGARRWSRAAWRLSDLRQSESPGATPGEGLPALISPLPPRLPRPAAPHRPADAADRQTSPTRAATPVAQQRASPERSRSTSLAGRGTFGGRLRCTDCRYGGVPGLHNSPSRTAGLPAPGCVTRREATPVPA